MRKRDEKGRFMGDSLTTATAAMVGQTQPGVNYTYNAPSLNYQTYYNAYDTSPLARLLIDTLPFDTVSEWREWQADKDKVNLIEKEEVRVKARKLVRELQIFARLEGESIIYVDIGDDPTKPIDVNRVKRGGLRFARVFRRKDYSYGNLITDPMSPWYNEPEYYQINTDADYISPMIHPSRVARYIHNPSPQRETGLPSLSSGLEVIKQYEAVIANTAFLVQKARTAVMKVEGLMDNVSDPVTEQQIISRYALFKYQEGNQGLGVIDKDKEDWSQSAYSFAGLDAIIQRMQQNVAAMWGYPVTRIFDRVQGGLGNSDEGSQKAYYQSVRRLQDNLITPTIPLLDELIVRSAIGEYPDDIYYNWRPLEQPNQKEIQDIGKIAADTLKVAVDGGFLAADVAETALISRLTESGCFPGMDQAHEDWVAAGGEIEESPDEVVRGDLPDDDGGDTVTP